MKLKSKLSTVLTIHDLKRKYSIMPIYEIGSNIQKIGFIVCEF